MDDKKEQREEKQCFEDKKNSIMTISQVLDFHSKNYTSLEKFWFYTSNIAIHDFEDGEEMIYFIEKNNGLFKEINEAHTKNENEGIFYIPRERLNEYTTNALKVKVSDLNLTTDQKFVGSRKLIIDPYEKQSLTNSKKGIAEKLLSENFSPGNTIRDLTESIDITRLEMILLDSDSVHSASLSGNAIAQISSVHIDSHDWGCYDEIAFQIKYGRYPNESISFATENIIGRNEFSFSNRKNSKKETKKLKLQDAYEYISKNQNKI